ncbi:Ig-like protein [Leptospira interrogans str. L1207]|nr:Ig-like protein [Leptospira interrogans str. L1207]
MPFFAYLDFSNRSADSSFNVSQISPGPNVTGVSLNTSIQVGFSQKLDSSSIQSQSIQLTQGNTIIPGNFTSTEKTLLFNPTSSLAASTVYSVSISKDIKSMDGSSLSEDYTWSFTTNTIVDLVAPDVSLRTPTIGANLVPNNTSVQIAFTETMNCTSINITNFTLKNNVTNVLEPSNVVCLGSSATFIPSALTPLNAGTNYTATILTVNDIVGNPIGAAFGWNFTTGAAPDVTPPVVTIQNLRNNSIVESGFVIGTATDAGTITSLEVSLDNGAFVPATGTNPWKFKLPSDINTWKQNSQHTIIARAKDLANNLTTTAAISVRKGNNKDINGDGYADLSSGEPVFNGSQGRVYVFHSAGVTQINSAAANSTLTGENATDRFGYSLSTGNMNGDNFADLAIGAPGYGAGVGGGFVVNQGKVYIHHGAAGGLGGVITTLTNDSAGEFGISLFTADFNGDGNSDLAIGSPNLGGGTGRVSVFTSAGGVGINTSTIGNAPLMINGTAVGNAFGISLTAQDLNLDGRPDLISATVIPNRVFVFHMPGAGAIGGFLTTGNATTQITSAFAGIGVSANAPKTPISGGDINGNGFPDLFVGGKF